MSISSIYLTLFLRENQTIVEIKFAAPSLEQEWVAWKKGDYQSALVI